MSPRFRATLSSVLTVLTLVFLIAPAQAGYTRINGSNPADPLNAHIYKLDNGLLVYLTENHESPRFYVEIAVRAGSKHDPAEATGLAHYLEHLLFKGSRNLGTLDYEKEKVYLDRITELYEEQYRETDPEKRKAIYAKINEQTGLAAQYAIPNELDRLYNAMGGDAVNAHTWHEETVYQVDLPSNRLEQWAVIESDRFLNPVFRLFQPELEVVYEEKNRTLDNKDRLIYYAVTKKLFKVHPYGQQPTIGTVDHLKNPSLKHVYDYYNTYYVPNNMAIFISGDIDITATMALIDKHFSAWQAKPLPAPKTWAEPPLQGAERLTIHYPGEEYAMLSFRTVSNRHPDAEALQLVAMILDNSTAGLINLNLNQQQKVRQAGSSPSLYNDSGFQTLWGIPKQSQTLEEVEKLLLEQMEKVKRGEFEDWIIPAIINDFKKNRKAGLESNGSRVSSMRASYLSFEEWDHAVAGLDRMAKLTKADVVKVANKYFGADYVAGYRLNGQHTVPSIEKPDIEQIDIDPTRESGFAARVIAMPVKELSPVFVDPAKDYQIKPYVEGVKLYHAKNPLNDLFSLTFTFDVGRRHQDKLSAASLLLNRSGTAKLDGEALKKEWYRLGTDFGINVGDYQTSISISGLDEQFKPSLALMMDYVKNPVAEQTTLDELIKIILVNREDAKKNFQQIHQAVVQRNRYGAESSFLRMTPNAEIERLTLQELHGLIKGLFAYQHRIAYVGSLPVDRVITALKTAHLVSGKLKPPPPHPFLKTRQPQETEILFFHKEMAQAQVRIEFGGQTVSEDQNPAIQLYNDYFGGDMSAIVFQELREARALAYAADARYVTGDRKGDQDLMVGLIGTQADKTSDAVGAFIDLLDNLPVSPERFDAAREALLNRYRTSKIGFRSVLDAIGAWERLELPVDPRKRRYEQILQADMDIMLKFHADRLKGRPKLISIVGDKNKINLESLSRYGKVIEVGLQDIFVF
ncbi:MAG: insulinase family protein [candidate division Zixibacteria bacterium]|nr:insulinase family protein [candidate division Zixibacteria bacterium]